MKNQDPGRRTRWLSKTLLVAMSVAAGLLLAEGGLRIARFQTGGLYRRADLVTGSSLRPNARAVNAREGYGIIRINSQGLRDHETTPIKPSSVFRVIMLGDSYLEAAQVDLDASVSKVLERMLRKEGQFEVLNFGVSGYGTTQEYLQLKEYGFKFSPDLVLLCLTLGNDVRNNSKTLNATPSLPYFNLNPEGELVLDDSFLSDPKFKSVLARDRTLWWRGLEWGCDHSRVLSLLVDIVRGYRAEDGAAETRRIRAGDIGALDPAFQGDWMIYDPSPKGEWTAAWQVTEKIILKIADLCRERRTDFGVVLVSNSVQVSERSRKEFLEKHPDLDLAYPNHRMLRLCEEHGIACVDLVPPLLAFHRATARYVHGFGSNPGSGHWNEDGHRVAAESIFQFMHESHLVPFYASR